jgi:penicillin-binding protein 1A
MAHPERTSKDGSKAPHARGSLGAALRFCLKWGLTAAVWALVAALGLVAFYAYDLPDVDQAFRPTRPPTVTILAADGSELATVGDLYGQPVTLKELPAHLAHAVIATEDRRFRDHVGLDAIGLARAALANFRAGRVVQGGSTITQQVAKNLFLKPERTLKRKVQELLLALWLERKFSKEQILTVYLNRVYLGAGAYGVEAAAQRYFGRSARALTLYESAMIAGLLKAPSRYNPLHDPERAAARARQVLANMVDAGFVEPGQARAATARKSVVVAQKTRAQTRYLADWVVEQLSGFVAPADRDLKVVTTVDAKLQRLAEAKLARLIAEQGAKADVGDAALVAVAPDGAVRALVGGVDYGTSQFNRATQAWRQPGSAFKPFVYLAALEAGLAPESRFVDAPLSIQGWSPKNFDGKFRGSVTAAEALAQSINTVAVLVAERTGRERVIRVARRLGLDAELAATPSLALGTEEVTLLGLTAAFAPLANGGFGVWPYAIETIADSQGRVLYRREGSGPGRVVAAHHVATMNAMLSDAVAHGTGKAARLDRPVAGKTGTSQNFRDAWFVGYSADLVAGVWMGNDDGQPMKNVTGGGLPARLWRDFMAEAHAGLPPRPLPGARAEPAPAAKSGPRPQPAPAPDNWWQRVFGGFSSGG